MRTLRPTLKHGLRRLVLPLCAILVAWTLIATLMPFQLLGATQAGIRYRIMLEHGGITLWQITPAGSFLDAFPANPQFWIWPETLEAGVSIDPNPNSPTGYNAVDFEQHILPAWIVVTPLILIALIWTIRQGIFIPRNGCPVCAYDTRNNPTDICPECGTDIPSAASPA